MCHHISTSLDLLHMFNLIGLLPLSPHLGMILRTTEIKTPKKFSHVKCDRCQGYELIVDKCTNLFRVVITDRVPTTTSKPDRTISLKVTHVIKEFSVVSPAETAIIPASPVTTTVCTFSSPALLLTPPSLSPLVGAYRQPLPPRPVNGSGLNPDPTRTRLGGYRKDCSGPVSVYPLTCIPV